MPTWLPSTPSTKPPDPPDPMRLFDPITVPEISRGIELKPVFPATIGLMRVVVEPEMAPRPPPWPGFEIVQLVKVAVPTFTIAVFRFAEKVLLTMTAEATFSRAPAMSAEFCEKVQSEIDSCAVWIGEPKKCPLKIAPPWPSKPTLAVN